MVPDVTNKKSPPATSVEVSKSVARVITVVLVYVYTPFHAAVVSFLTRIRVPTVCTFPPSIKLNTPVVVNVAPTPLVPLLYVIVPPVAVAKLPVVATKAA